MRTQYGYRETPSSEAKWPAWTRHTLRETCRARGWIMVAREVSPTRVVAL